MQRAERARLVGRRQIDAERGVFLTKAEVLAMIGGVGVRMDGFEKLSHERFDGNRTIINGLLEWKANQDGRQWAFLIFVPLVISLAVGLTLHMIGGKP